MGMKKVDFLSDSIIRKDGKLIKLLGGSTWLLSLPTLALVTDDVIIVFEKIVLEKNKTIEIASVYVDGDRITATHVDGRYITDSGLITTVVESLDDGAVLKLIDGSALSIPSYDRYDTGWWLPPYKALLTSNGFYLWNLKKAKRVWVNIR